LACDADLAGVRRFTSIAEAGKTGRLYAGNPKRTTVTLERNLAGAFKSIYLNTVTIAANSLHISPLSDLQLKSEPMGFSADIYSRLAANSQKPP